LNALAGESNGVFYTPVKASTGEQIISFDATLNGATGSCIISKVGGPSFDRPNGSGNGQEAISRSIDTRPQTAAVGPKWGSSVCTGGTVAAPNRTDVSGQIDFARSSSPPSNTATSDLTFVPMARDALTFAYYRASGGAPVTSLTRAQLDTLFTSGPQLIDPDGAGPLPSVNVIPCGIQIGSGTYKSWNTTAGVSTAEEGTATTTCNALIPADGANTGRAQEHDAVDLKNRGDVAPAGSQVIIGFSASQFIARSNLLATPTPPAGVGLGDISDDGTGANIGNPIATGTVAPNLAPRASFYNNTIFGRTVYNVIPTAVATDPIPNAIKSLFVTSGSAVCLATTTIQALGFLVDPSCGSTALTASLVDGTLN
jgi:hypothetical protein